MKGDFTRDTFDPAKQYSRVLMQQGRVQLDADWNEQTAILLSYMRALTRDLFGPAAGPKEGCGFEIKVNGSALSIGPGRYYVNGIPVTCAADEQLYSKQLGYPFDEATKIDPPKETLKTGPWLAYLDVWEAFVCNAQDDHIRESALGGPDTCGRAKVMWQVRILINPAKDCDSVASWTSTGTGALKARAKQDGKPDELCVIAPDSQYRGAENQLYRVEVHRGSAVKPDGKPANPANNASSGATFKWSRDNGSVIFPIRTLAGNIAELEHLGRDGRSTLTEGDWVEMIDDAMAARSGVGLLAQVNEINRDDRMVTLKLPAGVTALPAYPRKDADVHPLLRRWDHVGDLTKAEGALEIVVEDKWIALDDGVEVQFSKTGEFRAGDYWLIPARVATGDVEWPGAPDNPGAKPPDGPHHYYAPLMLMKGGTPADCRCCVERLKCMSKT